MERKIITPRFIVVASTIIIVALCRLIPHPPNFTPVVAMALFSGAYFTRKILAFLIPFFTMLLSDFLLNSFVYPTYQEGYFTSIATFSVYGSFLLIVCIGLLLSRKLKLLPIALGTLGSSILFFIITNFGSWISYNMYPHSLSGLATCYAAAIPFFNNALLGDIFFSALMFGGFYLLQLRFPVLAKARG